MWKESENVASSLELKETINHLQNNLFAQTLVWGGSGRRLSGPLIAVVLWRVGTSGEAAGGSPPPPSEEWSGEAISSLI